MDKLFAKKLNPAATLPTRVHSNDAGLDLYALEAVNLTPNEPIRVATGIAMAVPGGHVGLICDRSSLGARGIRTLGGVVDAGYRGEVQVILINLTKESIFLAKGDKIAQMLILPINTCAVEERTELDKTTRGEGGFGSSGR